MISFPYDCRHGKKFYANTLRPDTSIILPTFQAYGYGYLASSYTDADGLHLIYNNPSGPFDYPKVSNIFGTSLNWSGDFTLSCEIKIVSTTGSATRARFTLGIINVVYGDCQLWIQQIVGYDSILNINLPTGSVYMYTSLLSDTHWHLCELKKIGNTMWACVDHVPFLKTAFPGYKNTYCNVDIWNHPNGTGLRAYHQDVRNIRAETESGTVCLGRSGDLLKV